MFFFFSLFLQNRIVSPFCLALDRTDLSNFNWEREFCLEDEGIGRERAHSFCNWLLIEARITDRSVFGAFEFGFSREEKRLDLCLPNNIRNLSSPTPINFLLWRHLSPQKTQIIRWLRNL